MMALCYKYYKYNVNCVLTLINCKLVVILFSDTTALCISRSTEFSNEYRNNQYRV